MLHLPVHGSQRLVQFPRPVDLHRLELNVPRAREKEPSGLYVACLDSNVLGQE